MTDYVGSEGLIADAWIKATLAADGGAGGATTLVSGRLYQDIAPRASGGYAGAGYPMIVWQQQSPMAAINALGAQYVDSEGLYLIKAIGETQSYSSLAAIARRIYVLFHAKEAAIAGGRILSSVREREFRMAELTEGVSYRHYGHLFRIAVQPI
jgi:hypothetical protein